VSNVYETDNVASLMNDLEQYIDIDIIHKSLSSYTLMQLKEILNKLGLHEGVLSLLKDDDDYLTSLVNGTNADYPRINDYHAMNTRVFSVYLRELIGCYIDKNSPIMDNTDLTMNDDAQSNTNRIDEILSHICAKVFFFVCILSYPAFAIGVTILTFVSILTKHGRIGTDTKRGELGVYYTLTIGIIVNCVVMIVALYKFRRIHQIKNTLNNNLYIMHCFLVSLKTLAFAPLFLNLLYIHLWEDNYGYKAELWFGIARVMLILMPIFFDFREPYTMFIDISSQTDYDSSIFFITPIMGVMTLLRAFVDTTTYTAHTSSSGQYDTWFWVSIFAWNFICILILCASWIRICQNQTRYTIKNSVSTGLYTSGVFAMITVYFISYITNDVIMYLVIGIINGIFSLLIATSAHIAVNIQVVKDFNITDDEYVQTYDDFMAKGWVSTILDRQQKINYFYAVDKSITSTYSKNRFAIVPRFMNDVVKHVISLRNGMNDMNNTTDTDNTDSDKDNMMDDITIAGSTTGLWWMCFALYIQSIAINDNYIIGYICSSISIICMMMQYMYFIKNQTKYVQNLRNIQASITNITALFSYFTVVVIWYQTIVGYDNFGYIYISSILLIHSSLLISWLQIAYNRIIKIFTLSRFIAQYAQEIDNSYFSKIIITVFLGLGNVAMIMTDVYGIERGFLTDTQDKGKINRGVSYWYGMFIVKILLICVGYILTVRGLRNPSVHNFSSGVWYYGALFISYFVAFYIVMFTIFGLYINSIYSSNCGYEYGFYFECNDNIAYSLYAVSILPYFITLNPIPWIINT
jgi:hypothetical protein